jgi:ribosomal protein L5
MTLVRYEGNASSHDNTGAISMGPDEDPILVGGEGELDDEAIARLSGMGLILTPITKSGKKKASEPENKPAAGSA